MQRNVNSENECPVALTIAGSDSGGGAGIQADLKVFEALGVFGTSALTCVTVQSPDRVEAVHAVPPDIVSGQISVVCSDFPVAAIKTGMLYSVDIIRAVSEALKRNAPGVRVTLDPVMVATSGARLLREDAVHALMEELVPLAALITPNVPEAEILDGQSIDSPEAASAAAARISAKFGVSCVVKGGHLPGDPVRNFLSHENKCFEFSMRRIGALQTHGTGCAFSAAVTAFIARGFSVEKAVESAGGFVAAALEKSRPSGRHNPLAFRH